MIHLMEYHRLDIIPLSFEGSESSNEILTLKMNKFSNFYIVILSKGLVSTLAFIYGKMNICMHSKIK